jgi:hypothetical protein
LRLIAAKETRMKIKTKVRGGTLSKDGGRGCG